MIIWITGAGSGLGKALAETYAAQGNTLILTGRNENKLNEVASSLQSSGSVTHCLALDVSDQDAVKSAVEEVIAQHGRVDILINNAGVSQRSLVMDTDVNVGRTIMDVNFFGAVYLTTALVPHMLKQGGGSVAMISSAAGKFGFPRRSYYAASKHALHGFTDALALELHGSPVNFTLVCPGSVRTQIAQNALTGDGSAFKQADHRLDKGIPAELCARKIKKAIRRRKSEVYIGGQEVVMIYIKRFFPALFRFLGARVKVH